MFTYSVSIRGISENLHIYPMLGSLKRKQSWLRSRFNLNLIFMRQILLYTLPALIVGVSVYAMPNPTPEELIERENRQAIMDCIDTLSGTSLEIQKGTIECSKTPFRSITWTHSTGSSVLPSQWIKKENVITVAGLQKDTQKELKQHETKSSSVSVISATMQEEDKSFWTVYEIAIPLIRKYEWLQLKAYWDYNWYSIGYGTRAKNDSEVITQAEADARLWYIVKQVVTRVQADFPTLSSEQQAGLVSFAYNCEKWYKSVRDNWLKFHSEWCKTAWGKIKQGLVDRRTEESELIFN